MDRIVNVVIYYDNLKEVFDYAYGISTQTYYKYIDLVIVLNNTSKLNEIEIANELKELPIRTFLYNPKENLGYLNGLIYGYEQFIAEPDIDKPKWVIFSNTDIEYHNKKVIQQFMESVYDEDIWCVCPSVYSPGKKSYDNPEYVQRVPFKKIDFLIKLHENFLLSYLYHKLTKLKGKFSRNEKKQSQFIYSGKGCYYLIRYSFADLLATKKYGVLMYSEESYISELIRINNKKMFYDSSIEVVHLENLVTSKLATKKKIKYILESLRYIKETFYKDED